MGKRPSCFRNRFVRLETVYLKKIPKGREQGVEPTHPHGQVEHATASSAGGSPDGEERKGRGKGRGKGKGKQERRGDTKVRKERSRAEAQRR
jgi:hypothetical protein